MTRTLRPAVEVAVVASLGVRAGGARAAPRPRRGPQVLLAHHQLDPEAHQVERACGATRGKLKNWLLP